jgi:hypothetical protein
MAKQVHASMTFDLPLDPAEEAAALATVAVAWHQFYQTVKTATGINPWGQSFAMRTTRGPKAGSPRLRAVKGDAA